MFDQLQQAFRQQQPNVDYCSLRIVAEHSQSLTVRQDVAETPLTGIDRGFMVTVAHRGGLGYAASSDVSPAGLREALARATTLAERTAGFTLADYSAHAPGGAGGQFRSAVAREAATLPLAERLALLSEVCRGAAVDARIVDRSASLGFTRTEQRMVDSRGACVDQVFDFVVASVEATAHDNGVTQSRSNAGRYNGYCRQGGLEVLEQAAFRNDGARVAEEALQLVGAPNCPSGALDLLLMPDQMMLQIHESIGHPLELDRILGDERNFAGTSFVTPEMFGHYQYGSPLLNVVFDPAEAGEFASYAFDDEGTRAQREHLIRDGILLRPLGGAFSQARAGMAGVANARACSWNRPPIDRMANLNIEPGACSLEEMIAATEQGVLMRTNSSWSIDDSRNKFQFGCEYGRMIRNGQLAEVVKNPNYRGISATFWRSLAMVGNRATFEVMGTPFCGKGEPAQVIRVGHASPACLFRGVDVFGGEA